MAEDESSAQFTRDETSESLSDSERSMVNALRAPVVVDAAAFDARVMAAVRREPAFAGARRHSHRGLAVTGAAVAALAAMVLFVVAGGRGGAHTVRAARVAQNAHAVRNDAGVAAPAATRTVRFTFVASGASRVVVAGSFNGWNTVATPLRRVGKDTWSTDIPLGAGRYEYQFVIDGKRWVADPRAPHNAGDDFGATNSVVTVPIPGSA